MLALVAHTLGAIVPRAALRHVVVDGPLSCMLHVFCSLHRSTHPSAGPWSVGSTTWRFGPATTMTSLMCWMRRRQCHRPSCTRCCTGRRRSRQGVGLAHSQPALCLCARVSHKANRQPGCIGPESESGRGGRNAHACLQQKMPCSRAGTSLSLFMQRILNRLCHAALPAAPCVPCCAALVGVPLRQVPHCTRPAAVLQGGAAAVQQPLRGHHGAVHPGRHDPGSDRKGPLAAPAAVAHMSLRSTSTGGIESSTDLNYVLCTLWQQQGR